MAVLAQNSVKDAGVASGVFHMYADAQTLDILQTNPVDRLVVRMFQWDKPTVSFGYLLETDKVKAWSMDHGLSSIDVVKRPTGGGAVLHSTSDLSFSLVWRRERKFFSDRPRDCYAEIHERVLKKLSQHDGAMSLFTKDLGMCESSPTEKNLPICFNEPVCNDVMLEGKKVIGGALRITKNAILYQGTIQLPSIPLADLKDAVRRAFN